ncbi:DUF6168 family protein [Algibacter sp. L1A34]|uniref:DUF6168 family protein n=1 Tax=Algibacter sp. L1A34 TaxID=2686365 RepID=UPI0039772AF8
MTIKKLIINGFILIAVAVTSFFIHFLVNRSIEINKLIYSYSVNVLMAFGVIILMFFLQNKFKDQLGFVFMAASMIKLIFVFLLFYPNYNAEGDLKRIEFLAFFIPYVICLITECSILSRFLNDLDGSKASK